MILGLSAFAAVNRVSIVETDKPFPVRFVQGQRAVEPVRLFGAYRYTRDGGLHPVTSEWIDNQDLTIEIKQGVMAQIVHLFRTQPFSCHGEYRDRLA